MKPIFLFGPILALFLLISPVLALTLVDDIHMDSVVLRPDGKLTMTGSTDGEENVWFVYGGQPDIYSARTKNVTIHSAGVVNYTLKYGYFPGETIYVRLANSEGYSSEEQNLTLNELTPAPTTTYGSHIKNMTAAKFDPLKLMRELPDAFADHMGAPSHEMGLLIFWGFTISCLFIVLYLRSENVMTPALLGMVLGWVLLSYVPGDFKIMGQALLVIALGAMLFTIIKGRIR